jgi:ABC-2 type transport system permease protein
MLGPAMTTVLRAMFAEYKTILRDKGVLLIFMAGLAIYTSFYPLPYSTELLRQLPVIPIDEDNSATSRKLVQWVDATEEVQLIRPAADFAEARQRVLLGEASGVFIIPEHFERDILLGRQAVVSAYADATNFLVYRQIVTGAYKATATLSAGVEIRRFTAAGRVEKDAMRARDPLPVDTRPLFNPAGGYGTYVVPGALLLILQQTLLIAIGMLGGSRNERETGAPSAGGSVLPNLIARALAYFSIYIFYPFFYLAVTFRMFHLPAQGEPATILLFLIPYILSITFLGLTLTAFFRTREMSIPALLFTSMPAVFLIGFIWPPEAIPAALRALAFLLPTTAGCSGFLRINQMGASLYQVRFEWQVLWGLCALYFTLAWLVTAWMARRRRRYSPREDGIVAFRSASGAQV